MFISKNKIIIFVKMIKTNRNYQSHHSAIIEDGCQIGSGTKIWHFSHIMKSCIIGDNCSLGQNVVVSPKVIIGNNVKIQNNVSVFTGVICEDNVFLGPSCVFTNIKNPRSEINRKDSFVSTIVSFGASIGANATILCGITIGRYSMIGAGAVVTKSVSPYALVQGNPAKQVGWVSECGERLNFKNSLISTCEVSGEKYILNNNNIKKIQ